MGDILYDCYDCDGKSLGIIFANNCKELLEKEPRTAYVLGINYFTREPQWLEVRENGLFSAKDPRS